MMWPRLPRQRPTELMRAGPGQAQSETALGSSRSGLSTGGRGVEAGSKLLLASLFPRQL